MGRYCSDLRNWLGAGLVELGGEAADAVRAVHPDSLQRVNPALVRESFIGRGRPEVAGRSHRLHGLVVVPSRRIAEEVHRLMEALLEHPARAGDLVLQLRTARLGDVDVADGVR